jgi:hypothetical protein
MSRLVRQAGEEVASSLGVRRAVTRKLIHLMQYADKLSWIMAIIHETAGWLAHLIESLK